MRIAGPVCRTLLLLTLASCGSAAPGREPGPKNQGGLTKVLGAITTGCKVQNTCGYGGFCNHETGFCESRKCAQGCPNNTVCNEGLGLCQDPPPPRTPSDHLPQDDKIQVLPGMH